MAGKPAPQGEAEVNPFDSASDDQDSTLSTAINACSAR